RARQISAESSGRRGNGVRNQEPIRWRESPPGPQFPSRKLRSRRRKLQNRRLRLRGGPSNLQDARSNLQVRGQNLQDQRSIFKEPPLIFKDEPLIFKDPPSIFKISGGFCLIFGRERIASWLTFPTFGGRGLS